MNEDLNLVALAKELQTLETELERRAELVGRPVTKLGSAERRRVRAELDHDGLSVEPVAVKLLQQGSGVLQRGVLNEDSGTTGPGLGWFHPGEDHHAAAQLHRWLDGHEVAS